MRTKNQWDKEQMIQETSPARIQAFSDAVFAIIITIMILELKRPSAPTFRALLQEWPTWISYFVSYLFIAIVWMNHHYLLSHAARATLKLMWANFAHLLCVSLIPFFTDWIAETRLQPVPVVLYAAVFLSVNITYLWLIWQTMSTDKAVVAQRDVRHLLHVRSALSITLFAVAMIVAFWYPYIGFGIICGCLVLYLKPKLTGMP